MNNHDDQNSLSQQAEARLVDITTHPSNLDTLSPIALQQLVHDLQVHQIELEMQNDELRRVQLVLDQMRERYFDLYDLAPVGYCTVSDEGIILEANLTAANLLQQNRQALLKKPLSRFIHKHDQDIYYLTFKRLATNVQTQSCELRLQPAESAIFWAQLLLASAHENDHSVVRVVITDISERKRHEQELIAAKELAEAANQAKITFLARISHELRTPLSAIIGFTQIIKMSADAQSVGAHREDLDTILRSGWHLSRIIEDLINLSVIEAQKVVLNMESIDLSVCLENCLALLSPLAKARGIQVGYAQDHCHGMHVHADAFRLDQVLINLLANAIKYNREQGAVSVSCQPTSGGVRICVNDTGEGIRPEHLGQLFQPFSRLTARSYKIEGAGIGLSVAKQLTELMGGTIGVESVYGEGSCFWIELVTVVEASAGSVDQLLSQPKNQFQSTLLYIENNSDHIRLVQAVIARLPHIKLITAMSASYGLDIARAVQPDLILLDIGLPHQDGYEILQILQQDPDTRDIQLMALSAAANVYEINKGLKAGFKRYLTKPLNIPLFMQALADLLPVHCVR